MAGISELRQKLAEHAKKEAELERQHSLATRKAEIAQKKAKAAETAVERHFQQRLTLEGELKKQIANRDADAISRLDSHTLTFGGKTHVLTRNEALILRALRDRRNFTYGGESPFEQELKSNADFDIGVKITEADARKLEEKGLAKIKPANSPAYPGDHDRWIDLPHGKQYEQLRVGINALVQRALTETGRARKTKR